jgi:hypothetical protein
MLRNLVHFVCPDDRLWLELRNGTVNEMTPERLTECSGGVLNNWIVRTYYQLGLAGAPVTISSRPRRDAINVVCVSAFGRSDRLTDAFFVIPRADFHKPMLANFVVEQNSLERWTSRSVSIPHWPQPGIIKRDPSRDGRLEVVSFKGRTHNLDEEFRSQVFLDALAKLDIRLEIDAFEGIWSPHSWNDYRDCDAVLAVRNIRGTTVKSKPASKLVNAWIGNVVPMLGPEPAFQALRKSPLDFIEIYSPADAINALKYLRENPKIFTAIIANGEKRGINYTDQIITKVWIDALNGPIFDEFVRWRSKHKIHRMLSNIIMLLAEDKSKRSFRNEIKAGAPLLETIPRTFSLTDLDDYAR